jgi:hypothetical protein
MPFLKLICALSICLGVLRAEPLDTILVLEMSEGTEHATDRIRPRAFPEDDRAAVIGFLRSPQLLQPLTEDHDRLAAALRRAGARAGGAIVQAGKVSSASGVTAGVGAALHEALSQFSQDAPSDRRRAVLIIFGTEDPSLGARLDTLKAALSNVHARLYAVAVHRIDPRQTPLNPRPGVNYPFPTRTAQLLSELAAASGGRVYKRNWTLKEVLAEARRP